MAWPDEIAESLPDPRHDEPGDAQLRRDILDELSDHIDCTASEELRRDGNMTESDVWAAVVKRFGDPRMLAKRLWFDAMKG
ncbi:MAG: hypothetical protein O7G85_15510, partial [Planctomycetota bacterium]|nr:hypothetical protein [Planctomycetota bacterium]